VAPSSGRQVPFEKQEIHQMRMRTMLRTAVPVAMLAMALGACGDDDGGNSATDTTSAAADTTEICKLAKEMFEQDDFPTAAQIKEYTELAPEEIKDAVDTAGPPIIEADGDPAKFFAAIADDDVEAASNEINDWERENCDIEHDEQAPESATKIDEDAERVDVTSTEYSFAFDKNVPAGKVSFVLKNPGKEVHFMALSKLAEGKTIEEALQFEGDPEEAGLVTNAEYDSGLAAPGGEDEEVLTLDLTEGNWAMLCFIPGPDGTPHAFTGMAIPFTVK
jgi:hypothetical protein